MMQAPRSSTAEPRGWLQSTVGTLGSYAQTSTPAYSLAALFALSTPFGFASPAQAAAEAAAKLQHEKQLARVANAASSQGSNGLIARVVAKVQAQKAASAQTQAPLRTVPPFWQLAFFAAAFGTGGYMIDQGDVLNGSGVVTAWSLTYLLFKTLPSIRQLPRNPLALSLSAAVLSVGLGIHGSHYFDRTSWRGAIPSLSPAAGGEEVETGKRPRFIAFDKVGKTDERTALTSIFAGRQAASEATKTRSFEQTTSSPNIMHGPTRNNDDARTAAFLLRSGQSQPGLVVP